MKPGPRFAEIFGKNPIVAAQAPGRVNLMGDHTDYNQGFVLPTIIPQQTVVEAGFGADQHEVYSATLGRMTQFNGGELADFGRYVGGCVRVVEERGAKIPPLQLRISSDVPVGPGCRAAQRLKSRPSGRSTPCLTSASARTTSLCWRTEPRSSTPASPAG